METPGQIWVEINSTLSPGGPGVIGTMSVGQLQMVGPRSILALDAIGQTNDIVGVIGKATLDGKLSFSPAADFKPGANTSVPVLYYGSYTGTFSSMLLPVGYKEDYQTAKLNITVLDRTSVNDHVSQTVSQVVLQSNSTITATSTPSTAVVLPLIASGTAGPATLADPGYTIGGTAGSFGGSQSQTPPPADSRTPRKAPATKVGMCGRPA